MCSTEFQCQGPARGMGLDDDDDGAVLNFRLPLRR